LQHAAAAAAATTAVAKQQQQQHVPGFLFLSQLLALSLAFHGSSALN